MDLDITSMFNDINSFDHLASFDALGAFGEV